MPPHQTVLPACGGPSSTLLVEDTLAVISDCTVMPSIPEGQSHREPAPPVDWGPGGWRNDPFAQMWPQETLVVAISEIASAPEAAAQSVLPGPLSGQRPRSPQPDGRLTVDASASTPAAHGAPLCGAAGTDECAVGGHAIGRR